MPNCGGGHVRRTFTRVLALVETELSEAVEDIMEFVKEFSALMLDIHDMILKDKVLQLL